MDLERIDEIAEETARHVCESGSPAANKHNQRTISRAIQQAIIEHEQGKRANRGDAQESRRSRNGAKPAVP